MKSARKKDSITIAITNDNVNKLKIRIVPNENNKKSIREMEIPIQYDVQNLDIDLPNGYDKSIIINSAEFQKACKQLAPLSDNILVSCKDFSVAFSSDNSIYSNKITLGELENSDDSDNETEDQVEILLQNFKSITLTKIIKISGLCTNLQVFIENDLPLIFKSNVGSLGNITIYIKSNELLEKEKVE